MYGTRPYTREHTAAMRPSPVTISTACSKMCLSPKSVTSPCSRVYAQPESIAGMHVSVPLVAPKGLLDAPITCIPDATTRSKRGGHCELRVTKKGGDVRATSRWPHSAGLAERESKDMNNTTYNT